ncbi:MAG: NAD(P)/FAD-dependent oxidoreductase [Pseudonocardiales bacterium]|nr:NAD(P)/FAD-dependent oxidoreductase [Pseudonocardiales bacterium]MBV9729105.1 NAD(P)/FAD-dependent oxidoreductase [Pseudonocardiales bacterium]
MSRVVVVGAGFAGLAAVRELRKSGAQVTLVDHHLYSTFQPLLYQVASGGLNPGDIAYPTRNFVHRHGARFRRGSVTAIDIEAQELVLDGAARVVYDYLLLASGVTTNYFGVPGAAEHSLALYTRQEAIILRDRLMAGLETLATRGGSGDLTAVIVGGGTTGVETAGALAELRNAGVRAAFPEITPGQVNIVLVEQSPELLASYPPRLRRYALAQLRKRGVQVRLDTPVREVTHDTITVGDGAVLRADLTIWAAGVAAAAGVHEWGLPHDRRGRIVVDDHLRVASHPNLFVAGDLASLDGHPLPQQAQPAIQTGTHAGRQIRRLLASEPTQRFRYRDKGTMATIGRNAAVVALPYGVRVTGAPAWVAWLGLHIVMLLGNRNRLSTLLNLSWRYLAWPSGNSLIVGDLPAQD